MPNLGRSLDNSSKSLLWVLGDGGWWWVVVGDGGWWWVVCKVIPVFSLGPGQAEESLLTCFEDWSLAASVCLAGLLGSRHGWQGRCGWPWRGRVMWCLQPSCASSTPPTIMCILPPSLPPTDHHMLLLCNHFALAPWDDIYMVVGICHQPTPTIIQNQDFSLQSQT